MTNRTTKCGKSIKSIEHPGPQQPIANKRQTKLTRDQSATFLQVTLTRYGLLKSMVMEMEGTIIDQATKDHLGSQLIYIEGPLLKHFHSCQDRMATKAK